MSELIRELEEDIRRDQLRDAWKRYGWIIISLCVILVAGTAGSVGWKSYRAAQGEKYTAQLIAAASEKDDARRNAAYAQLMKDAGTHAQGAMAGLRLAADQRASGKEAEALATYRIIVETNYPAQFRHLARALATHTSINSGEELKLSPVDIGKSMPYYDTLREAEAWRLLSAGDKQKAFERFSALAEDVGTPTAQRQRMNMIVSYLSTQVTE